MSRHKPGCPADGGYGHGPEPCICGAEAAAPPAAPSDVAGLIARQVWLMTAEPKQMGFVEWANNLREWSNEAATALSALAAELAAAREDAERYRWLRSCEHEMWGVEHDRGTGNFEFICNEELDAAIDAARGGK